MNCEVVKMANANVLFVICIISRSANNINQELQ